MAELHNENYAVVQSTFAPFKSRQASSFDVNILYPNILLSKTRSVHAIASGEMIDRSVSPVFSIDPVVQVVDSQFNTKSTNADYLNSVPLSETGALRVDQILASSNPLNTESLCCLSKSLFPVTKFEYFEDFTLPKIEFPLPNIQGEHENILNNVEYLEHTKSAVLTKRKPKYCSSNAQQSEEAMAKKSRAGKVLSGRIYRAKVAKSLNALKSSLPYSEKGNQASVLNDVIDYIKFLKLRLNVLSKSRLNGEALAHSLIHIEGYGHYLLHPQSIQQPLEETVGHLLKSNPQAANELLEYKGLAILPMDYAYAILLNCSAPSNSSQ